MGGGCLIGDAGGELDAGAQIKVADLDGEQLDGVHAQNVLRLQIAMGDSFFVQKIQTGGNLFDDLGRLVFGETHVLLDSCQQLSTVDLVDVKRKQFGYPGN